jgi:hypothetical protein
MCPDKKIQWFDNNPDWRPEDRLEAGRIVRQRWSESYAHLNVALNSTGSSANAQPKKVSRGHLLSKCIVASH